jgi:hypothetical protein
MLKTGEEYVCRSAVDQWQASANLTIKTRATEAEEYWLQL